MSREACYSALFSRLQGVETTPALKVIDRRVRFLHEMGAAELPALFMAVDHQTIVTRNGLPARRTLGARLFLYGANPDRHTAAGIVLNGMIDAVENALAPEPASDAQTLGGLVSHAWLEGQIEVFEGPQGDRSAAIAIVQMLMP
jgi:hypothetical protein